MGRSLDDRLRQFEADKDLWLKERAAQASHLERDLENAGRQAWSEATRAGVNLMARTPQELRALGAQVLAQQGSSIATGRVTSGPSALNQSSAKLSATTATNSQPSRIEKPSFVDQQLWNGLMQADAAVRGATNTLTFGGADRFAAGMDALVSGGLNHWRQRYDANLAQEQARDQYDASHRTAAQATGQIGGTALGLALVGPTEGVANIAPRLPGAATLTGREAAALLGGGAIAGETMQTASDIAAGGRSSSIGDKAGAAVGGAAGAATLPFGPGRAGAVGGWVTSAAQDVFNGRPISLERAGKSAIAGNLLGGVAGRIGARASNDLPKAAKGRLGEAMGDVRSTINGERRLWAPKSRDYIAEGDYWYPDARDARTGQLRTEDKFGYGAELSPNQARAQSMLGPDFRLNHFTPEDIGSLAVLPAGPAGAQLFGPDDRYWY